MTALTVSPPVHDAGVRSRAWDPWDALEARPHLIVVRAPLPHPLRGAITDTEPRVVVVDEDLVEGEADSTAGHEAVHDELDMIWPDDAPAGIVQCGERYVTREVTRRLVPLDELEALVSQCEEEGFPVGASDVIEWFPSASVDVAHMALRLLRWERERKQGRRQMEEPDA